MRSGPQVFPARLNAGMAIATVASAFSKHAVDLARQVLAADLRLRGQLQRPHRRDPAFAVEPRGEIERSVSERVTDLAEKVQRRQVQPGLRARGAGRCHRHRHVAAFDLDALEVHDPPFAVGLRARRRLVLRAFPSRRHRAGEVHAARVAEQPELRRVDAERAHAHLAVKQAHDRERHIDTGDVGDQPAVRIAQRHAAQRQVVTAEGEPCDIEVALDLIVDARDDRAAQPFAAPRRPQNQHRRTGQERNRCHDGPRYLQSNLGAALHVDFSAGETSHPPSSEQITDGIRRQARPWSFARHA
jgi:hypothetical protein